MEKTDIDSLISYWIYFMIAFCCISILANIVSYVLDFIFKAIFFALFLGIPILFLLNNPIYLAVLAIPIFCMCANFMDENKKLEKN